MTLFVITKIWKQPKYPLAGEWINGGTFTLGYYSGIKKKKKKCKKHE